VWDIAARSGPRPVNGVDRPAVPTALGFTADSLLTWMTATGPSSFEVVVADPETGATVPHGLGAFSAPTFFNTTADPTIAVVSYGTPADGTSRVVARSLVDGTTVREFPPASAFVENGTLVVSCAEPATPPTAIVQRSDTGAEMARIRMLGDECTIGRLAAAVVDGGYLVEPRSTTRDKHYDVVRLTRLADGRSYDLTLPSDLNLDPANPITLTRSMTVVDRDDEPPTVVLSRGSSLLRLRPDTTPAGAATDHLALSRDGRYFVAIADDGTTVFERRSGAELATLRTDDLDEGQHLTSVGEGVGEVTRTDTAWYFTHYMLPTLDVSTRIVIPRLADTAPSTVAAVSDSEEGIMTFTDGVLSDFDSATGRLRSEPVLVSESAADQAWYRQNASFQARPGHPGEAVVLGRNEVQLWNLAQQPPQHRTLPARQGSAIYNVVFDPTGRTLAGLAVGNTVEIRDVDTGVLERPPFPIPASASAVGFNAEGHLVLHMGSGGENVFRLSFWDLATGSESASLVISTAHATAGVVADDGLTLLIDGVDGAIPFPLPLTAQQWFDRLCQLSDRPFTDAERAQLPAGASADPPCG
jgi:hypothetical protein